MAVGGDFLAQLEDGHTDGHDEAEEGELQGVPGLQAEHADREGDQGHRLEEDEHEDRYDDLLQLGPASLVDGTALAELDVEGELIVVNVARAHLHRGFQRQLEGHVVRGQVGLHGVEEGALSAAGHLFDRVRVSCDFHRLGHLKQSR